MALANLEEEKKKHAQPMEAQERASQSLRSPDYQMPAPEEASVPPLPQARPQEPQEAPESLVGGAMEQGVEKMASSPQRAQDAPQQDSRGIAGQMDQEDVVMRREDPPAGAGRFEPPARQSVDPEKIRQVAWDMEQDQALRYEVPKLKRFKSRAKQSQLQERTQMAMEDASWQRQQSARRYLDYHGVEMEPLPDGGYRAARNEDGSIRFKAGPVGDLRQREDGSWVKPMRDVRGEVVEMDILELGDFRVDSASGRRWTKDAMGRIIDLGEDPFEVERKSLLSDREKLRLEEDAARIQEQELRMGIREADLELKDQTKIYDQLEKRRLALKQSWRADMDPKDPVMRNFMAVDAQRSKWLAENPEYLEKRKAIEAQKAELAQIAQGRVNRARQLLDIEVRRDALGASGVLSRLPAKQAISQANRQTQVQTQSGKSIMLTQDGEGNTVALSPERSEHVQNLAKGINTRNHLEKAKEEGRVNGKRYEQTKASTDTFVSKELLSLAEIQNGTVSQENFALLAGLISEFSGKDAMDSSLEVLETLAKNGVSTYAERPVEQQIADLRFSREVEGFSEEEIMKRAMSDSAFRRMFYARLPEEDRRKYVELEQQVAQGKRDAQAALERQIALDSRTMGQEMWDNVTDLGVGASHAFHSAFVITPIRLKGLLFEDGPLETRKSLQLANTWDELFMEAGANPDGFFRKAGGVLGSGFSFLLGQGAVMGSLKLAGMGAVTVQRATMAASGLMGAGLNGAASIPESMALGLSDAETWSRFLWSSGLGTLEMFGIGGMLARFDSFTGGTFKKYLFAVGKEVLEEAAQEGTQAAAQEFHDKLKGIKKVSEEGRAPREKTWMEIMGDTAENAAWGAFGGLVFGSILGGKATLEQRKAMMLPKTYTDLFSSYNDAVSKYKEAIAAGDVGAVAQAKDLAGIYEDAFAARAMDSSGIEGNRFSAVDKVLGSESMSARAAQELAGGDGRTGLMMDALGQSGRDVYGDPVKFSAIDKLVADKKLTPAQARGVINRWVAGRMIADLTAIGQGKEGQSVARLNFLHQAGLVAREADGKISMTNAGARLLPRSVRKTIVKNPDAWRLSDKDDSSFVDLWARRGIKLMVDAEGKADPSTQTNVPAPAVVETADATAQAGSAVLSGEMIAEDVIEPQATTESAPQAETQTSGAVAGAGEFLVQVDYELPTGDRGQRVQRVRAESAEEASEKVRVRTEKAGTKVLSLSVETPQVAQEASAGQPQQAAVAAETLPTSQQEGVVPASGTREFRVRVDYELANGKRGQGGRKVVARTPEEAERMVRERAEKAGTKIHALSVETPEGVQIPTVRAWNAPGVQEDTPYLNAIRAAQYQVIEDDVRVAQALGPAWNILTHPLVMRGGVVADMDHSSAMSVKDGQITFNPSKLAVEFDADPDSVMAILGEEFFHRVGQLAGVRYGEFWGKLPAKFREVVLNAYPALREEAMSDAQRGAEAFRMMLQDRIRVELEGDTVRFVSGDGQITEEVRSRSLGEWILDAVQKVRNYLRNLVENLQRDGASAEDIGYVQDALRDAENFLASLAPQIGARADIAEVETATGEQQQETRPVEGVSSVQEERQEAVSDEGQVESATAVTEGSGHEVTESEQAESAVPAEIENQEQEGERSLESVPEQETQTEESSGEEVAVGRDEEKLFNQAKAILEGPPVARVSKKDVPIIDGKIIQSAVDWMKKNPQSDAQTLIGAIRISPDDIDVSFSHTHYPNKLAVLPKLSEILERAAYIGNARDWIRENADNHYFAAPVEIDGEPKIVFIRVISEAGVPSRLHVHEIFTEEEIEKVGAIYPSQLPLNRGMQPSPSVEARGSMSDLYRSLIKGVLDVKGDAPKGQEKITDFGEKLGGAKKDKFEGMSLSEDLSDEVIANSTLSKLWPKSQIDAVEEVEAAAFLHVIRGMIPAKPRKGYKLATWVKQYKRVRDLFQEFALGQDSKTILTRFEQVVSSDKMKHLSPAHFQALSHMRLLTGIPRQHWGRIGKVEYYPDAKREKQDADGNAVMERGVTVYEPYPLAYVEVDGRRLGGVSLEEITEKARLAVEGKARRKPMFFEVRKRRNGEVFINKKGDRLHRPLRTFENADDAFAFIRSNPDELVTEWERIKARENVGERDVRGKTNRLRSGKDWRNGKDVTPEAFSRAFGFRGVEFGNWVSQGRGATARQGMLNQAFDAFSDLAEVLGIPTQGISLNGILGIGFGSRGSGWASAHYEPDGAIINLTKTRGAGSLAHEWFHAMDNYFQRARNPEGIYESEGDYVTRIPNVYYADASGSRMSKEKYDWMRERGSDMEGWQEVGGIREEVLVAFYDLVSALNASPMAKRARLVDSGRKGYWSEDVEMAARAFENYVIFKLNKEGHHNDYLANVVSLKDFKQDVGRYPYLLDEEIESVASAFDVLFNTIETQETESGVRLFSQSANYSLARENELIRDSSNNIVGISEEARSDIQADRDRVRNEAIASGQMVIDGDSVTVYAPNGKKSNLAPEQWITVRTKRFIEWFGDWWNASHKAFLKGEPVSVLTGNEFAYDPEKKLSERVAEWFQVNHGGSVARHDLGSIALTFRGVKDSWFHGQGVEKAAAFASVPDIIKDGRIVRSVLGYKPGVDRFVIVAPITIGVAPYTGVVVVQRDANTQRFYLHEVFFQGEKKPRTSSTARTSGKTGKRSGTDAEALQTIAEEILSVNPENASKVVDENGEPLVVYHGTGNVFSTFRKDRAAWTSAARELANDYAQMRGEWHNGTPRIISAFANIRNPFNLDEIKGEGRLEDLFAILRKQSPNDIERLNELQRIAENGRRREESGPSYSLHDFVQDRRFLFGRDGDEAIREAFEIAGRDGFMLVEQDNLTYGVNLSNQIKSATDNAGTFENETGDIFYTQESNHLTPKQRERLEHESAAMQDALKAWESLSESEQGRLRGVARTQMKEVRERYVETPGWMKAPNGKNTKLSEMQWLLVRTPVFKRWFGDWLGRKELTIENSSLTKKEADQELVFILGKALINTETGIVGIINSRQAGKLTSDVAMLKSRNNGFSREQHYAVAAKIADLWKNATLIEKRGDKNNDPNIKSIKRFAAPIVIDDKTNFVTMLAKESVEHGHRIYTIEMHELTTLRSILDESTQQNVEQHTPFRSVNDIVDQLIEKVNPDFISKAVDENGEPLATPNYDGKAGIFGAFRREGIVEEKGERLSAQSPREQKAKESVTARVETMTNAIEAVEDSVEKGENKVKRDLPVSTRTLSALKSLFVSGRLDKIDFFTPGNKEILRQTSREGAITANAIRELMARVETSAMRSFGSFFRRPENKKRWNRFKAELLPTASFLNAVDVDADGVLQYADFWQRSGEMSEKQFEEFGVAVGKEYNHYDGMKYRIARKVEQPQRNGVIKTFYQVERFVPATLQQSLYEDFAQKYPEAVQWLDMWISPGTESDMVTTASGAQVPGFNRFALHKYFGTTPWGELGNIPAYTPDVSATRTLGAMMANVFNRHYFSPGREYKSGAAREAGEVRDLFAGFKIRAVEAALEHQRRKMANELIKNSLKDVPLDGVIPPDFVPFNLETLNRILKAYHVAKGLNEQEFEALRFISKTEMQGNPDGVNYEQEFRGQGGAVEGLSKEDVERLVAFAGEIVPRAVQSKDKMIHKTVIAELNRPLANHTINNRALRILGGMVSSLTGGYLVQPFTWANNIGSNELFKTMRAVQRGYESIFLLAFGETRDAKIAGKDAWNVAKGMILDRWYNPIFRKLRNRIVVPELFDGNNRYTSLSMPERDDSAFEILRSGDVPSAILKAVRYGDMDGWAKQAIMVASYRAHAEVAADESGIKFENRTARKEWMENWIKHEAPETIHKEAYDAACLYCLDYTNVPAFLDEGHQVIVGGHDLTAEVNLLRRATIPFMKFPYNLARQGKRLTLDSLVDLVGKGKTKKERARSLSNLFMMASLLGLFRMLFDDDDEGISKVGAEYDDLGRRLEGAYNTAGRVNITDTPAGRVISAVAKMNGLDADNLDMFARVRTMPYATSVIGLSSLIDAMSGQENAQNLQGNLNAVMEDFLSEGVFMKLAHSVFGGRSDFDEYKNADYIWGEASMDLLTARILPPPLLRMATQLADPVSRRSSPSGGLDYSPGFLDAIRAKIPLVSRGLVPNGRVRVGAPDSAKTLEALFTLQEMGVAHLASREFVDDSGRVRMAYVSPDSIYERGRWLELIRLAGLNVKPVDREGYRQAVRGETAETF